MTEKPPVCAETPRVLLDAVVNTGVVGTDALSELLDTVRLHGEHVVRLAPRPAAGVSFPGGAATMHIVECGRIRIQAPSLAQGIVLNAGELVLLPHGGPHTVFAGDAVHSRPLRAEDLSTTANPDEDLWLTGTVTFDAAAADRLLSALPAAIVLSAPDQERHDWLDVSCRLLAREVRDVQPGSAVMVSRILDLLFIQTLRAWARDAQIGPSWLAAAMDPVIGQALTVIHQDHARPWTIPSLAATLGMSRSAFAERFTALVGQAPGSYLLDRRLDIAAAQLRDQPRTSIANTAAKVGYTSEAAFSRAFRRRFGTSPSHWRRQP